MSSPIVIRVEFPALQSLVDYLTADTQQKVNALSEQVASLSAKLAASGARLDNAAHDHQPD